MNRAPTKAKAPAGSQRYEKQIRLWQAGLTAVRERLGRSFVAALIAFGSVEIKPGSLAPPPQRAKTGIAGGPVRSG